MEIALRVITAFLVGISTSIVVSVLYPIFLKREKANEEKAKSENRVYFSKKMTAFFISILILINITGILIVALPDVITEIMGFNYIATICVWWIPVILMDIYYSLILYTHAIYDDEKIIVKKIFRKQKTYYFSDIISYTKTGNLKVVTTTGKFTLFNIYAGTNSLRQLIAEKTAQS